MTEQCQDECYGVQCDLLDGHLGDHLFTWPRREQPPTETEYESVRILRLQPGDVVIVRVAADITKPQAQDIRDELRVKFLGHEVLVLGAGADLEIVRNADTDIRCDATNTTGQCLDHQGHLGDHQWPDAVSPKDPNVTYRPGPMPKGNT